jgi:hypothetical protein
MHLTTTNLVRYRLKTPWPSCIRMPAKASVSRSKTNSAPE